MKTLGVFSLFLIATLLVACGNTDETGSSYPADTSGKSYSYPPKLSECKVSSNGPSPLIGYQWYLYNNGDDKSKAFVQDNTGTNHANVLQQAHTIATGKGVIVNVIDTGLELNHEDLCTEQSRSWDYSENDNNPQPLANSGDHGTSVAGIIGMKNNGIGGLGVAPGVTLIGHAMIKRGSGVVTLADYANALGIKITSGRMSVTNLAQVYNMSYGRRASTGGKPESINDNENTLNRQYHKAGRNGRGGKGYIYVKSAGNEYEKESDGSAVSCNNGKTSCASTSFDPKHVIAESIVVAATNSLGRLTTYSTTGPAIWVSAPGGELAYDTAHLAKYKLRVEDTTDVGPAMITTDVMSCSKGYSKVVPIPFSTTTFPKNPFEYTASGPNPLNKNCNYTSTFNGTSAAAPVVSGVAALMLDANPNLTWRDVKHILAKTATKIDVHDADVDIQGIKIKNGWTTNAANYDFSTFYGFGQVDAYSAVKMAQDYSADNWGAYTEKTYASTLSLPIPDNNPTGVSHTLTAANSVAFVESVRLVFSTNGGNPADYSIHLTSPLGTLSVMKWTNDSFTAGSITDFGILSNAFYGENANGTWTIRFFDLLSGNQGSLTKASLEIFGHN